MVTLNKELRLDTFKESQYEFARTHGYTQTLFGHRRYFKLLSKGVTEERILKKFSCTRRSVWDHPKAKQYMLDLWAEQRKCVNMPIQGTAAGIIKKASVEWYRKYNKIHPLVLQVHDENMVRTDNPEEAVSLMKEVLTQAADIVDVPMKVDPSIGKRWSDLK